MPSAAKQRVMEKIADNQDSQTNSLGSTSSNASEVLSTKPDVGKQTAGEVHNNDIIQTRLFDTKIQMKFSYGVGSTNIVSMWCANQDMPDVNEMVPIARFSFTSAATLKIKVETENSQLSMALRDKLKRLSPNIIEKLGQSQSTIVACQTFAKQLAGNVELKNGAKKRIVTERMLLESSYGRKPEEMCKNLQKVFFAVRKIEKTAKVEELKSLSIYINLLIKDKEDSQGGVRLEAERVFNQHMDKNGFFSWYLRKKDNTGKLSPTKYYGTALPDDINLETDRIHFHPQYVANIYGISISKHVKKSSKKQLQFS